MTQLLLERPLVCIDTETTGINPKHERIVQIGLVKLYPDKPATEWMTLVNPGRPIAPEISAIHGITDEMVRNAPSFKSVQVSGILSKGLEDCDVMGYNGQFDLRMITEEYRRNGMVPPMWRETRLDPGRIFQRLYPRTLTAAYEQFVAIDDGFAEKAHDALEDSRATVAVLEGILSAHPDLPRTVDELADFCGEPRNGDLDVDPDGKIQWRFGEATIMFGDKQYGVPLRKAQRGFLKWMLDGDFSPATKKIVSDALEGFYPERKTDGSST